MITDTMDLKKLLSNTIDDIVPGSGVVIRKAALNSNKCPTEGKLLEDYKSHDDDLKENFPKPKTQQIETLKDLLLLEKPGPAKNASELEKGDGITNNNGNFLTILQQCGKSAGAIEMEMEKLKLCVPEIESDSFKNFQYELQKQYLTSPKWIEKTAKIKFNIDNSPNRSKKANGPISSKLFLASSKQSSRVETSGELFGIYDSIANEDESEDDNNLYFDENIDYGDKFYRSLDFDPCLNGMYEEHKLMNTEQQQKLRQTIFLSLKRGREFTEQIKIVAAKKQRSN